MMFTIQAELEYPDKGSNVEIWMLGSDVPEKNNVELEVLGPLEDLEPGDSASLNVRWGVCRCPSVKKVVPVGVISEHLVLADGILKGSLGVFYNGMLQVLYLDEQRQPIGSKELMDVSPQAVVRIAQPVKEIPTSVFSVRYQLVDPDKKTIGDITEIALK